MHVAGHEADARLPRAGDLLRPAARILRTCHTLTETLTQQYHPTEGPNTLKLHRHEPAINPIFHSEISQGKLLRIMGGCLQPLHKVTPLVQVGLGVPAQAKSTCPEHPIAAHMLP